ncbi:hypothetical protein Tco_0195422 [Tanacetum coccineum]
MSWRFLPRISVRSWRRMRGSLKQLEEFQDNLMRPSGLAFIPPSRGLILMSAIRDSLRTLTFRFLSGVFPYKRSDASTWVLWFFITVLDDAMAETFCSCRLLWIFAMDEWRNWKEIYLNGSPLFVDRFCVHCVPLSAEALIEPPVELSPTSHLCYLLVFLEIRYPVGGKVKGKIVLQPGWLACTFSQLDDAARDVLFVL